MGKVTILGASRVDPIQHTIFPSCILIEGRLVILPSPEVSIIHQLKCPRLTKGLKIGDTEASRSPTIERRESLITLIHLIGLPKRGLRELKPSAIRAIELVREPAIDIAT